MLDKNNSILWDEYRKHKENEIFKNETLKLYMLGLAMIVTIDKFIAKHPDFDGTNELLAIEGMVSKAKEQYQAIAASYNNDIEAVMGLVRPKLKEVLKKNDFDPGALILYAMTGMFLPLDREESDELHHILLTLLQYEAMGIDVSDSKELWPFFADSLDFEVNYERNQMDGKSVAPISFKSRHDTKGFLTEAAQKTVAEFVFMNLSNIDPQWMSLFSENPRLAASVISLKRGITEDLWKVFCNEDNDSYLESYNQFRSDVLSDSDKALHQMILFATTQMAVSGVTFIRCLATADLLCMRSCDTELGKDDQDLLDFCIKELENRSAFFPDGVILEDVLYSLHREQNLPEPYFMFFTVFYMSNYGKFRSFARSAYEKYSADLRSHAAPSTPSAAQGTSEAQPQAKSAPEPAAQKTESPRSAASSGVAPATSASAKPDDGPPERQNAGGQSRQAAPDGPEAQPETREPAPSSVQPIVLRGAAASDESSQDRVSALIQLNGTSGLLNIVHLAVIALLFLSTFSRGGGAFVFFALIEAGVRAASCYFASRKYAAVWEDGKFQTSLMITSFGLAGFLVCFLGCLIKGYFSIALFLLAAREAAVFVLIRKSTMAGR